MQNEAQTTTSPTPSTEQLKLSREYLYAAVAAQSGLPVEFMDSEKHAELIDRTLTRMRERIIGQDTALAKLASTLKAKTAERFIGWEESIRSLSPSWDNRPIACFMAVGPTGIGKTESAKLLADTLFGGRLITLHASEVGPEAAHGTSTWTGSPPGYVGSDRGGVLTNGLRQYHSGVILIDELEKADRGAVQNVILPLMGDGMVTDKNNGETLNASDFVIFCTSNIDVSPQMIQGIGFRSDENEDDDLSGLFDALSAHILPEVIGRFNAVLCYRPLSLETQWGIWSCLRHELTSKIGAGTRIQLDEAAKRFVQRQFTAIQTGARGIRDLFLDQLMPLAIGLKTGETLSVTVQNDRLVCLPASALVA